MCRNWAAVRKLDDISTATSTSTLPSTSSSTVTTTSMAAWVVTAPPEHSGLNISTKDKVIAGAVGGGLGAVALLGGLLGGLLTTTDAPVVTSTLPPLRFLERLGAERPKSLAQHMSSLHPWWWAAIGCTVSAAFVYLLVSVQFKNGRSKRVRTPRHGKLLDSSPVEPETENTDEEIEGRDEFEAGQHHAVDTQHVVRVVTAPPVYVTSLTPRSVP